MRQRTSWSALLILATLLTGPGSGRAGAQPPQPRPPQEGHVEAGGGVRLFYRVLGAARDTLVVLHGGPGFSMAYLADDLAPLAARHTLILYDQRGAGKSTPSGDLRENTSQHLIADIETLRRHLGIEKWFLVFGGSWGSCLALMYIQAHPGVVGRVVLRGVSTGRREEYAWSRGGNGAKRVWPDGYEKFLSPLPEEDHADPIKGYYKLLTDEKIGDDVKRAASREWNRWDITLCSLRPTYEKLEDEVWCMQHALLESHYFSHGCFIEDGSLLWKENIDKIRHIPSKPPFPLSLLATNTIPFLTPACVFPATIVQGRYDMITPPKTAWDLRNAWLETDQGGRTLEVSWGGGAQQSRSQREEEEKDELNSSRLACRFLCSSSSFPTQGTPPRSLVSRTSSSMLRTSSGPLAATLMLAQLRLAQMRMVMLLLQRKTPRPRPCRRRPLLRN